MIRITPHNILRHEFIGLNVKVARANNGNLQGLHGRVIDETRNMLVLSHGERRLFIPKDVATFRFKLPDSTLVDVDGSRLVARPENRLKTKVRRW